MLEHRRRMIRDRSNRFREGRFGDGSPAPAFSIEVAFLGPLWDSR